MRLYKVSDLERIDKIIDLSREGQVIYVVTPTRREAVDTAQYVGELVKRVSPYTQICIPRIGTAFIEIALSSWMVSSCRYTVRIFFISSDKEDYRGVKFDTVVIPDIDYDKTSSNMAFISKSIPSCFSDSVDAVIFCKYAYQYNNGARKTVMLYDPYQTDQTDLLGDFIDSFRISGKRGV